MMNKVYEYYQQLIKLGERMKQFQEQFSESDILTLEKQTIALLEENNLLCSSEQNMQEYSQPILKILRNRAEQGQTLVNESFCCLDKLL